MRLMARFKEVFRSAFRELSFPKRWLLRAAIALLLVGGVATIGAATTGNGDSSKGWSFTALTSGAGCILGFLAGATFRVFLKLALLLGVVVAGALYGLHFMGWIDLPWDSFGEISSAITKYIKQESASVHDLLTSWLPSSGLTGLGLLSGVTQKPDLDPDD